MADGNPFEDPTVQGAMTYSPPSSAGQDAYEAQVTTQMPVQANAYDESGYAADTTAVPLMGQGEAPTHVTSETGAIQTSAEHKRPPPPAWCMRMFMWLPVKQMAFIGGVAFVVSSILDFIFFSPSFLGIVVNLLLIFFGLISMCVEMPSFALTRKIQLRVYFWGRFMSRFWGRGFFYMFLCLMCFAELADNFPCLTGPAAMYVFVVSIFMLLVSKSAGSKFRRIHAFLAAGSEGDAMIGMIANKFDSYDMDSDSRIGSSAINAMARDAGRTLSNAERHAIQSFLDESCNGSVSKQDFLKKMQFDFAVKWL